MFVNTPSEFICPFLPPDTHNQPGGQCDCCTSWLFHPDNGRASDIQYRVDVTDLIEIQLIQVLII